MTERLISPDRAFFRNSIIVCAHPDDEVLWFSSILRDVDEVLVVFQDLWSMPDIGAQRLAAVAQHPHPNITLLGVREAGTAGYADWEKPVPNDVGIAFSKRVVRRDLKRIALKALDRTLPMTFRHSEVKVPKLYHDNFARISSILTPRLRKGMNVFTHNPWGEYGHEDHVQIFRVLESLRDRIGFRLWVNNYFTDRSDALAQQYLHRRGYDLIRASIDHLFTRQVADIYRNNGCWTWVENWRWFEEECFFDIPSTSGDPEPSRAAPPMNYFPNA
jgi:LmbE family N-acetylglucosaminyl deacetylase